MHWRPRFVNMIYRSGTQVIQNLGFEGGHLSFDWQGQGKMPSQLVRYEGMSFDFDPIIAKHQ